MRIDKINLQNEVFEELTIVAKVTSLVDVWLAQCRCGKHIQIKGWRFRRRKLFCCGCLKYPRQKDHPLWRRWYHWIEKFDVCERWKMDFWQFVQDITPWGDDDRLYRTDSRYPLGPGNFHWSPIKKMYGNKTLTLETDSGQVYLHDWACGRGLQPQYKRVKTLYDRYFVTGEEELIEVLEKDGILSAQPSTDSTCTD